MFKAGCRNKGEDKRRGICAKAGRGNYSGQIRRHTRRNARGIHCVFERRDADQQKISIWSSTRTAGRSFENNAEKCRIYRKRAT